MCVTLAAGLSAQEKSPSYALVSSLIIPGGGQFYCENRTKGILFFVAQTFFLAATILEHQKTESYWRRYLEEGNPQDHEEYVKHSNWRTDLLWLGGACYAISAVDAYVSAHFFRFEVDRNVKIVLFQVQF